MHTDIVLFLILSKNAYTKFSAVPHPPSRRISHCEAIFHPPDRMDFVEKKHLHSQVLFSCVWLRNRVRILVGKIQFVSLHIANQSGVYFLHIIVNAILIRAEMILYAL